MKCPVCSKGEIIVYEFNEQITVYSPVCNSCGLTHQRYFNTPEAAMEAIRPVVSEELVSKIVEIARAIEEEDAMGNFFMRDNPPDAFIKQELEKFRNKE